MVWVLGPGLTDSVALRLSLDEGVTSPRPWVLPLAYLSLGMAVGVDMSVDWRRGGRPRPFAGGAERVVGGWLLSPMEPCPLRCRTDQHVFFTDVPAGSDGWPDEERVFELSQCHLHHPCSIPLHPLQQVSLLAADHASPTLPALIVFSLATLTTPHQTSSTSR
jgi:hypothetical protein